MKHITENRQQLPFRTHGLLEELGEQELLDVVYVLLICLGICLA